MPTKNINAEKIQGNLDVNGLSATTFNVNNQYDLPSNSPTNGDFFMYSGGSSSWNFIQESSIIGTTGGTIPFVNDIGTDFEYKYGFNYDLNNLNITSSPNTGVVIDKEGGITISGNTGGVIILSGNNDTLSAATVSSNNDLLLYATGTTPSVYGQDKQLYLSSSNSYVGINTTTPQATLHVKGNSSTTGQALLIHNGTNSGYAVQVYNNRDTINSGVTYNAVGVNFNNSSTNQLYYYSLPTTSGKTNYVLVRVQPRGGNNIGTGKFNNFWHDPLQGNQYWSTGTTGPNNNTILKPTLPDVEFTWNPQDLSNKRNTFAYDNPSYQNVESFDNILVANGTVNILSGPTNYRRKMSRTFISSNLARYIGNYNAGTMSDNFYNISNVLGYASSANMYINGGSTPFRSSELTIENTELRNLFFSGLGTYVAVRNCIDIGGINGNVITGGENLFVFGKQTIIRQKKYDSKNITNAGDTDYTPNVKNVISFGSGNGNSVSRAEISTYDDTIMIGDCSYMYNLHGANRFNTPTKNFYDRPYPYQDKGVFIGAKWKTDQAPAAFIQDPLLEGGKIPVNFCFGPYNIFYPLDTYNTRIDTGINRPGSGAGILYLEKGYLNPYSKYNQSVPREVVKNAVGLWSNEQFKSSEYSPSQNSSLLIYSDNDTAHLIGCGLYVNPVKNVANRIGNNYSGSTYDLSGSSAMLDVVGSGTTSSTTSVRIKNSGDTVGLEVLDGTTTTTPNAQDVYFNGIPTGSGGLTAGWLYKDGTTDELSIVPGSSIAGNYVAATDEQFLELRLLSQTQVYSDLGLTVITDNSLVQQINDLSGNNNHATQTTSGGRLTWNVSTSTLNNYSYFSNIDTSRFMNLTNGLSLSASSVDDTGFCMTVVMKINTTDTFRLFESSTTDDFLGEFSYNGTTNHCNWTHSGSTNSVTSNGSGAESSYILGYWAVFSFFINNGETNLNSYINNENNQKINITTNVFRNLDRILVGGDIDVAEFTLYNNHSYVNPNNPGVDLTSEVSRLMTKYNIT